MEREEVCGGREEHPFPWPTTWLLASTRNSCVGAGTAVGNWLRRTEKPLQEDVEGPGVSRMAQLLGEQLCYFSINELEDGAQGPLNLGGNTFQGAWNEDDDSRVLSTDSQIAPISSPLPPPSAVKVTSSWQ